METSMAITVILIGAALVIAGVLDLFWGALRRRPLSDPHRSISDAKPTLEPRGQGLRFLGLVRNWLGIGMIAIGMAILIAYA